DEWRLHTPFRPNDPSSLQTTITTYRPACPWHCLTACPRPYKVLYGFFGHAAAYYAFLPLASSAYTAVRESGPPHWFGLASELTLQPDAPQHQNFEAGAGWVDVLHAVAGQGCQGIHWTRVIGEGSQLLSDHLECDLFRASCSVLAWLVGRPRQAPAGGPELD